MDQKSRKTVLRWWQGMNLPPKELKDQQIPPAPPSHKAQLRRCESVDSAIFTEGFRALWLKLGDQITDGDYVDQQMETWAAISALLVHVRKDTKQRFAFQAGHKTDGDKSVVGRSRSAAGL
jgi:CRISPR system Cascade subunit CasB